MKTIATMIICEHWALINTKRQVMNLPLVFYPRNLWS